MNTSGMYDALNRLLTALQRSLPVYLTYASPWTHRGEEKSLDVIQYIADDQAQLAARVAQHILDSYGPVDLGDYPLDFPDTNDLAFDYLLGKLVACQKADVAVMEGCVAALAADRAAQVLAEEALGAARGHLETLEELAAAAAKEGVSWAKP